MGDGEACCISSPAPSRLIQPSLSPPTLLSQGQRKT